MNNIRSLRNAGAAVLAMMAGAFSANAGADQIIDIMDIGDSDTTADGTVIVADPNPTSPSTGTGVFEPFLRVGAGTGALCCSTGNGSHNDGAQLGYNTDTGEPDINFDTKNGSSWTRSVEFGELGSVTIGEQSYYVLSLDANQLGRPRSSKNIIQISDLQIYIGADLATPEADGGYTGTIFDSSDNSLAGVAPVWTLDNATNGDVTINLAASICDSNGQCGSGHGDMGVLIPVAYLSGLETDNFVLYTEYFGANDGFEEWRFAGGPVQVPEPATLSLLGGALLVLVGYRRRRIRSEVA